MRPFLTITANAFMELVRQPIYLILLVSSVAFMAFLASLYYNTLDNDPKLVKDSVLAVALVAGLFGAVFNASASVAQEIRAGTALAVLAKPVGRFSFILAKFLGVAAAVTLQTFSHLLTALLASRMSFDSYGTPDTVALGILAGALALAFLLGGFSNYFLRRPFVGDTSFAVVALLAGAFVLINSLDKQGHWQSFGTGVDWRMAPAVILIWLALLMIAGLAVACTTRLEMLPTLAVCSGFFLLGLMSDYLFGRAAAEGSWWAKTAYAALPNWQLFWLADALEGRKVIPWSYVGQAGEYAAGWLAASLALALLLFEDRELS